MGRSRRRARTTSTPVPTVAPADLRRTLGAYLAGGIALTILVLIGTIAIAGTLDPWLVLAVDAAAAFALYRWAQSRLAGLPLSDEDRIMQTLAGGLLVMGLLYAAVAAFVIRVA
jgi:hypothetical protein